ncbi:MAG: serine dehydratase [Bacteroidetes bacterium GWF2_38_335]|nr:MAG: serine dehydratase [Bacteroidetes bacterium GWF2_38_335]OFY81246.1 MAG: serine dehydratase [Bacteroidetes bacterium RIFOXYA12_FULL_38_20]
MNSRIPDFNDVCAAHERIKPFINRTPVMTSRSLNEITGASLFFKCENFQRVGAFKYRGATNAVLLLDPEKAIKGVATHSSGNHAAALALAAKINGLPAYIVMPENAPEIKKIAVKGYGAQITFCKPTLQAREEILQMVVEKTGAAFIHPFDNSNIVAGQGTAARELIMDFPDLDIVMAPVGGGGLLSGTSISAKSMKPGIKVIAAEPEMANDAFKSYYSDKLVPSLNPKTIADGLLTSLSDLTLSIIRKNVDEIITVREETIIRAMRLVWERMKIIIEPSSAVTLAVVLENPEKFKNKKTGLIISGGNVDLNKLPF